MTAGCVCLNAVLSLIKKTYIQKNFSKYDCLHVFHLASDLSWSGCKYACLSAKAIININSCLNMDICMFPTEEELQAYLSGIT